MRHEDGVHLPVLQPLEAMWGLACPLVGADVGRLAEECAEELARDAPSDVLALSGLSVDTPRFVAIARALGRRHRALKLGPPVGRRAASLDGGVEGFLRRRSSSFRNGLRRAERRAAERGIVFHRLRPAAAEVGAFYERVLAVEAQSWKGQEGVGFAHSNMIDFYRQMVPRLAARGALRAIFAELDGKDVGFCFGGILGQRYRGLQFSFAAGLEEIALGNLLQLEMIAALSAEGVAIYDLGTDVEYKMRWGEIAFETVMLLALPPR
jgi:CelD/BcsL family acetyltransferase involved in cellulose biosynthesis